MEKFLREDHSPRKRMRTESYADINVNTEVASDNSDLFTKDNVFDENDVFQVDSSKPQTPRSITGKDSSPSQDSTELLNILSDTILTLQNDISSNHSHIDELKNKCEALEEKIKILSESLKDAISTIHKQRDEYNFLKERIVEMEERMPPTSDVLCADGTFIWKINGVRKRIEEAIKQDQSSIYSPSYCLSTYGYRVRLRLFLNGDGKERGKSVSLFFVLMRGEYDNLLTWPFNRKVTFCLYDQTNTKSHFIRSFIPDPKSKSFIRPTTDMNFSSGIPDFCPVQTIHQDNNNYVRNDSMYIRCLVDFDGTTSQSMRERCQADLSIPVLLQAAHKDQPISSSNQVDSLQPYQ